MNNNKVLQTAERLRMRIRKRYPNAPAMMVENIVGMAIKLDDNLSKLRRVVISDILSISYVCADIADSILVDVESEIRAQGRFKDGLKRDINQAKRVYRNMQFVCDRAAGTRKPVFIDACDATQEKIAKDLLTYKYAAKNVLDKYNIENSMTVAQLFIACRILYLATESYNYIIETARKDLLKIYQMAMQRPPIDTRKVIKEMFSEYDPDGIQQAWNRMAFGYIDLPHEVMLTIRNDDNFLLAEQIIQHKLFNTKEVNAVIDEVAKQHNIKAEEICF